MRRAQYTGQAISGVTYTGRPFTAPKTPHPRDGMVPVTVRGPSCRLCVPQLFRLALRQLVSRAAGV